MVAIYQKLGYKSYLISTIVDSDTPLSILFGYKSYLISTIVDKRLRANAQIGYKSYLISTIVDRISVLSLKRRL